MRDRLDFALPVMRASSSSDPGACSTITRNRSRLPAERTLAKDSVEVNQTFGSSGAMRCSPPSGHGSTRLACDRERKVEFHPVMRHLRRDPPALAAFQADQAIARHRPQPVAMVLRLAALLLRQWMRVVEPDQPLAIRAPFRR